MEIIDGFVAIVAFIFAGLVSLVLAMPFAMLIEKHLDPWPARPMDNSEKKAAWAKRYHQASPITPNSHPWRWREIKGNDQHE